MRTKLNQNSKVKLSILYASLLASGIVGVGSISYFNSDSVHALTYSKTTDITFTINPSVSISLSTDTLTIDDLSPSAKKESNTITLTVQSNNATGYEVGSTVGNNTNYPTTDLKHSTDYDTTKTLTKFTSLATNASIDYTENGTNLTTGTWGYTYATSTDDGTTWGDWQNYSGLPLYTASYDNRDSDDEQTKANVPATLVSTDNPSSTKVNFKIAAAAQDQQYSGEYNNVINFVTVVNPAVTTIYMQDLTSSTIATLLPEVGSTATVTDSRDSQEYTIAKLADGKYWMTENLNLAGGTALSADDTDVTSEYISGFTTQGNLTKDDDKKTITLPASATAGFNNNSNAYVYNSGTKENCGGSDQNVPCYSYYSWIAATLGGKQANGSTAQTSDGYNAAASICPKGWRLPTSTTSNAAATTSPNWKTGDWYALMTAYGAGLESGYYNYSAASFYTNAGPGTTPNFLLAGYYDPGSFSNGGSRGFYWSATAGSATRAYGGVFGSSYVTSANNYYRYSGSSVRCMFAE